MANEITLAASLNLTRSGVELANWDTGAVNFTQVGSRVNRSVQTVTTTGGALQIGSVGTLGYIMLKSLDTFTNNIQYLLRTSGDTTGAAFAQLAAGEVALFKAGPGLTAPYISAGSTSQVQVMCFEL